MGKKFFVNVLIIACLYFAAFSSFYNDSLLQLSLYVILPFSFILCFSSAVGTFRVDCINGSLCSQHQLCTPRIESNTGRYPYILCFWRYSQKEGYDSLFIYRLYYSLYECLELCPQQYTWRYNIWRGTIE